MRGFRESVRGSYGVAAVQGGDAPPLPQAWNAWPKCPSCGSNMVRRNGPFGEFFGCGGFPKCRTTLPSEALQEVNTKEVAADY